MTGTNAAIGGGGIHHVAMKVKDFDASVKFYTQVMGFTPVMSWGEGSGRAVMLDSGDGSCVELFAGGSSEPRPEGAWTHLAFKSGNVDAAFERIRKAGVKVIMEPANVDVPSNPPRTVRIAFFAGLDGETVELFSIVK